MTITHHRLDERRPPLTYLAPEAFDRARIAVRRSFP
jgi:hypothetical protein